MRKIPYGQPHFADLRRRGMFYADKTPFLPLLESDEYGRCPALGAVTPVSQAV